MNICPYCKAELSDEQLHAGRCPACSHDLTHSTAYQNDATRDDPEMTVPGGSSDSVALAGSVDLGDDGANRTVDSFGATVDPTAGTHSGGDNGRGGDGEQTRSGNAFGTQGATAATVGSWTDRPDAGQDANASSINLGKTQGQTHAPEENGEASTLGGDAFPRAEDNRDAGSTSVDMSASVDESRPAGSDTAMLFGALDEDDEDTRQLRALRACDTIAPGMTSETDTVQGLGAVAQKDTVHGLDGIQGQDTLEGFAPLHNAETYTPGASDGPPQASKALDGSIDTQPSSSESDTVQGLGAMREGSTIHDLDGLSEASTLQGMQALHEGATVAPTDQGAPTLAPIGETGASHVLPAHRDTNGEIAASVGGLASPRAGDNLPQTAPPNGMESAGTIAAGMASVATGDGDIPDEEFESFWTDLPASSGMTMKSVLQEVANTGGSFSIKKRTVAREGERVNAETDYELIEILGQGGMGVVFEARQTSVDRVIAIKRVKDSRNLKADQKDKFFGEAVVTGDLDHPNIIPIYDLGVDDEGLPFYAMKRMRGTPWDDTIKKKSLHENLSILMDVADAMAFAHSKNIIHRDLKPENVMLGDYGEVVVMDWGLAASVGEGGKATPITKLRGVACTPAYAAPEMAKAQMHRIGTRSDVYLLGAILFEIVTGRRPHHGKRVLDCISAAARNEIVPTKESGELLEIAYKAMATKPDDRYETVQAFQQAIRDYQSHEESIVLSQKAREDLAAAQGAKEYDAYAKALFGFRQALDLWDGNKDARAGLVEAQLAYAEQAYAQGDLDLAASLLSREEGSHRPLIERVAEAKAQREAHARQTQMLRRVAVGLVAVILVVLTGAYLLVSAQRDAAERARDEAEVARANAEEQKRKAIEARKDAERAAEAEKRAAEAEKKAREIAEVERKKAQDNLAKFLAEEKARIQSERELAEAGLLLQQRDQWALDPAQAKAAQADAAKRHDLEAELVLTLPDRAKTPLAFVLVPEGRFVMGSPATEADRAGSEYLHPVEITRPFYMAKTELSQAQWTAIVGALPEGVKPLVAPHTWPATGMSWNEVREVLLPKLNADAPEGMRFDLPTEAEWEYACRAGTNTAFYLGADEEALDQAGWYIQNSMNRLRRIGRKTPNAWGLFDMHGGVGEWCLDQFDERFYLEGGLRDPFRGGDGSNRINRGGSWKNEMRHCRAAYRSWAIATNSFDFVGVRLVLRPFERLAPTTTPRDAGEIGGATDASTSGPAKGAASAKDKPSPPGAKP